MSKNKLVRKVWKLLTPGYGLLTEYIHSVYCPRSLMLLGKVFSRKVYRYFYHYVTIDLFTVTAAILNLLHLRSIMGCPGGTRSVSTRAFRAQIELHCIFLGKRR